MVPSSIPRRIVVDLGNSRMKWGMLGPDGRLASRATLSLDDSAAWESTPPHWGPIPEDRWAVSSVHPQAAEHLEGLLARCEGARVSWFRSALDVAAVLGAEPPRGAGTDRAFAALAASELIPRGAPGLVISCGTALTFERIDGDGRWEGGAIAAGLGMVARALNGQTAQLPLVEPRGEPDPWGDSTVAALEAGIYWGTVGAVRELIARQDPPGSTRRERIWTGGDAGRLAAAIDGPNGRIVPDLVLAGVALAAFAIPPGRFLP